MIDLTFALMMLVFHGQQPVESAPPAVHVTGAVAKPGRYPLTEGLTVASLVEKAGGFTEVWTTVLIMRPVERRATYCIATLKTALKAGDTLSIQPGPQSMTKVVCDGPPPPEATPTKPN